MILWLLLIVFLVLFMQNPYIVNEMLMNEPPSRVHLFGTDAIGRDVYSRVLTGVGYSFAIMAIAISLALVIGVTVGIIAALSPKWLGERVIVVVDFITSLPSIFYILLIVSLIQPSIWTLGMIIGCCSWMTIARQVRIILLAERQQLYVEMAKQIGTTRWHRVIRYYVPVLLPIISTTAIQEAIHAILTEATISFLGFGLAINTPTLGNLLIDAQTYFLIGAWWNVLFPGIFIGLMIGFLLHFKNVIFKGGFVHDSRPTRNNPLFGKNTRTRCVIYFKCWREGRSNRKKWDW